MLTRTFTQILVKKQQSWPPVCILHTNEYIHVRIQVNHVHTYIYTYIHVHISTCFLYVYEDALAKHTLAICIHTYIHIHAWIHTYIHTYIQNFIEGLEAANEVPAKAFRVLNLQVGQTLDGVPFPFEVCISINLHK
jgi:hypothetical protein